MGLATPDGEDLGYYPVGDKHVCDRCFEDEYIKEYIRGQAQATKCDYCHRRSRKLIAAPMDDVIEYIIDCVSTEWGDPDNEGVPVDEGEYVWPVTDSYDLITGEVPLEANQDALDDIIQAIRDRQWFPKDYKTAEPMLSGWSRFSEQVKHHRRYFFALGEENVWTPDIRPSEFLDRLGGEILEMGLRKTIATSDAVYRARVHKPGITYLTATDLGTPRAESAIYANRMSPSGIPMFYGSLDIDTAIAETRRTKPIRPSVATVGTFKPLRELTVLDLTSLPEVPSIFDINRNYLRASIIFLRAFVADLTKPIERDEKSHIEYVPTQVFTEYIRHSFKLPDGSRLEGILYPSSVNPPGVSCVLFVENDECCDKGVPQRQWRPYVLTLDSVETRTLA